MSPELIESWRLPRNYTPAKGVSETLGYHGRGNRGWPLGNIQLELDLGYRRGCCPGDLLTSFPLSGFVYWELRMVSCTV